MSTKEDIVNDEGADRRTLSGTMTISDRLCNMQRKDIPSTEDENEVRGGKVCERVEGLLKIHSLSL